jgi:hypothetical protein
MSHPDKNGADRIESLLRTTGRRPVVPADRAARVKARVRAHWEAERIRRSRNRRAWIVTGVAAAASITTAVGLGVRQRMASPPVTMQAARVEMVVESAWLQPPGSASPSPLRSGDRIEVGCEVATEDRGRIALRMSRGHSVRIDAGTRVRVVSDRVIALDRGAVYVDSRGPAGAPAGSLEVRTPFGSIRDIGTQFEVRLEDSLRVRVREGRIVLAGAAASSEVEAGHELEIGEDGRATRRESAAFGAEWEWVGAVTPMLDLEGRSVQEFLDWVARERGLRLRFEGREAASAAPAIKLHGSIDGMTLEQALESVLPTCRMSHRVDGGVLTVRSSKGPRESS